MSISRYFLEKANFFIMQIILMFLLMLFLSLLNNSLMSIFIIISIWLIILISHQFIVYFKAKKLYQEMNSLLDSLDQSYLISELMKKPTNLNEQVYYNILKQASKSMNERINQIELERIAYQEYIEEWVHEIKTPISTASLINEQLNNQPLDKSLKSINDYVEQALYYARSGNVEKDYFIKEVALDELIHQSLMHYRTLILENKIQLVVDESCASIVYTDEKWMRFILRQILLNAIQYKKEGDSVIKCYANSYEKAVQLIIEDNGIGIYPQDVSKVFDKGFTGSNRSKDKSTGIGLYLCKKLCDKLGIMISIESSLNHYTKVKITFPKGDMLK